MSKRIRYIIDEIKDQYLLADGSDRPWIIGYSGGKDSTALLTLVWLALKEIKTENLRWIRQVFVVSNDTMVENPIISTYVKRTLKKIEREAVQQDIPVRVQMTTPRLEDSFWVNFLGKGYPVPTNTFRWCTERLKIRPTSRFIEEQLFDFEEAIILLGTRKAESSSRAKSIKKHSVRGKRLKKHPNHNNVFVYSPIKDLLLGEVWYIINSIPSPWGAENDELFKIYSDASADDYECPTVITSKSHKSCGQSRFGCWVCTLVKEDKSMSALVEKTASWMKPLLDFRNDIASGRNEKQNRYHLRRNKTVAEDGLGRMHPNYCAQTLEKLLRIQRDLNEADPDIELISHQELIAIQVNWHRDMVFEHNVSDIYNIVYDKKIEMDERNKRIEKELNLLKEVCEVDEHSEDFQAIQDMLKLQQNKALLMRKRGLIDDIETRLEALIKNN